MSLAPIVVASSGGDVVRKLRIPQAVEFVTVVIRPTTQYKNLIWDATLSVRSSQSTEKTTSIISKNYLTVCVTASTQSRKLAKSLNNPFHVLIPEIFSHGNILAFTRNDNAPSVVSKLRLQRLPVRMSKGYFTKANGDLKLYSRDSGCFSLRKPEI